MARVRIAVEIVEEMVFGFTPNPVSIRGVEMNGRGELVFEIEGPDVPDTRAVLAICTQQQNRAGQRFVTMAFEPYQPAPLVEVSPDC